jgi:hypothetical protein
MTKPFCVQCLEFRSVLMVCVSELFLLLTFFRVGSLGCQVDGVIGWTAEQADYRISRLKRANKKEVIPRSPDEAIK